MVIAEGTLVIDGSDLPLVKVPRNPHLYTVHPGQLLDFAIGGGQWASGYYSPDLDEEDDHIASHQWMSLGGSSFAGLLYGMTVRLHEEIHESYQGE